LLALVAACGVALALVAIGDDDEGGTGASAAGIGAGGGTIPATTSTTTEDEPAVTTASGAPKVTQFRSPRNFWCLPAQPGQAQVIVGWKVPSAESATVALDGQRLHSGIRKNPPFWVPAGDASGIGATVVFACRPGESHRVTVRWRMPSAPPTERTVTVHKAARR